MKVNRFTCCSAGLHSVAVVDPISPYARRENSVNRRNGSIETLMLVAGASAGPEAA